MKNIKIKDKLIANVVFAIAVCGALAVVLVFFQVKSGVLDVEKENLKIIANLQSNEINSSFGDLSSSIEELSKRFLVVDIFENYSQEKSSNLVEMMKSCNSSNDFQELQLIDKSGNVIVSMNDGEFSSVNHSSKRYFIESIKGDPFVSFFEGSIFGTNGYYLSVPVENEDGINVGVLLAVIKRDVIANIVNKQKTFNDAHLMFVDSDGIVLASDLNERIYKSLGVIDDKSLSVIKEEGRFSNVEFLQYGIIQEVLPSIGNKASVFDIYDEADKEREILVVSKLEGFQFYLIIEKEVDKYLNDIYKMIFYLIIFIIAPVIFAFILIYFLISNYLQPLSVLKAAAEEVMAGYYPKINIDTNDEFEELGLVFNEMSEKIKKDKQRVIDEVKKRTQSTEELNRHMVNRELKMRELKKEIKKLKNL